MSVIRPAESVSQGLGVALLKGPLVENMRRRVPGYIGLVSDAGYVQVPRCPPCALWVIASTCQPIIGEARCLVGWDMLAAASVYWYRPDQMNMVKIREAISSPVISAGNPCANASFCHRDNRSRLDAGCNIKLP